MLVEYPLIGSSGRLEVSWLTDPGCTRSRNEDAVGAFTQGPEGAFLFIVADGLGGGPAGAIASQMAVDIVHNSVFGASVQGDEAELLRHAFLFANREILKRAESHPDLLGMGSTCTTALIRGRELHWAHAGDTRCYLFSPQEARLLTRDHHSKKVRQEDSSRTRFVSQSVNLLSSYLGMEDDIQVDVSSRPVILSAGDVVLLCSDGFYNLVPGTEMGEMLRTQGADDACRAMIALARERGGPDNITVLIASLHD